MGLSLNQLSADILSDVANSTFTGVQTGSCLIVSGQNTIGDGGGGFYFYDASSTATADGFLIIRQNVLAPTDPGRWFRRASLPQTQTDWNQATSSAVDFIKNKPTIPSVLRTTSTQSFSLVGTGATGTQISATKDCTVRFYVSTSTTSTIGGPASSVVTLKKCITNSATEGDWTSVGAVQSDQTITLAVALQSVQVVRGLVETDLPAGWFVKLVNSGSGTHSESFISGEKTVYG